VDFGTALRNNARCISRLSQQLNAGANQLLDKIWGKVK